MLGKRERGLPEEASSLESSVHALRGGYGRMHHTRSSLIDRPLLTQGSHTTAEIRLIHSITREKEKKLEGTFVSIVEKEEEKKAKEPEMIGNAGRVWKIAYN